MNPATVDLPQTYEERLKNVEIAQTRLEIEMTLLQRQFDEMPEVVQQLTLQIDELRKLINACCSSSH